MAKKKEEEAIVTNAIAGSAVVATVEGEPAEVTIAPPAPMVALKGVPTDPHEMLRHMAHMLREDAEKAAIVAENPTNVFVEKRNKIADDIDDFLKLCEERGHRGLG